MNPLAAERSSFPWRPTVAVPWRRRALRPYLAALRGGLASAVHFRANFVAWLLEGPLHVAILFLLWRTIYRVTARIGGLDFSEMMGYFLVVYLLRRVFSAGEVVNFQVWSDINQGKLDAYLVRPIRFGWFKFAGTLASPLVELVVGVPFFIAFSLWLGLPMLRNPLVLTAFLASLPAAFGLLFLIQFLIGSLTFWTERIFGFRDILYSVLMLFSGQLIPLSALPGWAGELSRWLPFAGIYYTPATIYAQPRLSPLVAELGVRQLAWLAVLGALAAVVWRRGLARYTSHGG
jgi:ABC-2 type transport system permease protein